jgi:hypothetical protein
MTTIRMMNMGQGCLKYVDELATLFSKMEGIVTKDIDTNFYSQLNQVRINSKWNLLANFDIPKWNSELEMYATCAITYKYTLKLLVHSDSLSIKEDQNNFYSNQFN